MIRVFSKSPPSLIHSNKRDSSKYCAAQEQIGHDTSDYRQLKDQIEELIHKGKLTKWVVREVKRHKAQGVG